MRVKIKCPNQEAFALAQGTLQINSVKTEVVNSKRLYIATEELPVYVKATLEHFGCSIVEDQQYKVENE